MSNPKNHSYSRMSTFVEQCERRHAFDALIPESDSSPALARGNHVHDALEQLARHMIAGKSALEAAETVAHSPPKGYLKVHDLIPYLHAAAKVFEFIKPTSAEQWFKADYGAKLVGKIDLVSSVTPVFGHDGLPTHSKEVPCVLDHKTIGDPQKIKSAYEARSSMQLRTYCIVTGLSNAGYLYYLPGGPPVRGVTVDFTQEELDLTEKWLRKQIATIESRWAEAKRLGQSGEKSGEPVVDVYDLLPFSLSPTPGKGLCSAKWCRHFGLCLGAEGKDQE